MKWGFVFILLQASGDVATGAECEIHEVIPGDCSQSAISDCKNATAQNLPSYSCCRSSSSSSVTLLAKALPSVL